MAKLVLAAAREAKLSEFLDAVTNDPTSTGHPDAAAAQAGLDWRKLQADAGSDVVNEEHEAIRRFLGEVHISDVPFFGGMLRTIQKDGQPDDSTFVVTQPFASKDFKQNVDAMMHCRTAHFADVAIGRYHCDG
ncbi:hypothetical protein AWL63_18290 [Sphingomonas panacis]|uniref:Uncharacterized protein n=2 Tax=Sphingomonas panacis TaxID=1560345 RepID=A0A1B3ZDT7_9SPHN|nr:hypothetical protein AWL63_18290 [Sphingomonas panacis]